VRRRPPSGTPPTESARTAAIRLLSRRDYTVAELVRKLTDRGHARDDIDAALAHLQANGSVDDRRVGAAHVRAASAGKGRGIHRITRELEARGIGRELARELLADLSQDDELESVRRVLARLRVQLPLPAEERRRVFARLLRRGFGADAIRRALKAGDDDE